MIINIFSLYNFRYVFLVLGGNNITKECTPAAIFDDLKNVVLELKSCGVERVFVSAILPRGRFPAHTGMSEKTFNKIRKSVNDRIKKLKCCDYVDTGKRLQYPKHYDKDLVHPGAKEGWMLKLRHCVVTSFSKTLLKSVVIRP